MANTWTPPCVPDLLIYVPLSQWWCILSSHAIRVSLSIFAFSALRCAKIALETPPCSIFYLHTSIVVFIYSRHLIIREYDTTPYRRCILSTERPSAALSSANLVDLSILELHQNTTPRSYRCCTLSTERPTYYRCCILSTDELRPSTYTMVDTYCWTPTNLGDAHFPSRF